MVAARRHKLQLTTQLKATATDDHDDDDMSTGSVPHGDQLGYSDRIVVFRGILATSVVAIFLLCVMPATDGTTTSRTVAATMVATNENPMYIRGPVVENGSAVNVAAIAFDVVEDAVTVEKVEQNAEDEEGGKDHHEEEEEEKVDQTIAEEEDDEKDGEDSEGEENGEEEEEGDSEGEENGEDEEGEEEEVEDEEGEGEEIEDEEGDGEEIENLDQAEEEGEGEEVLTDEEPMNASGGDSDDNAGEEMESLAANRNEYSKEA